MKQIKMFSSNCSLWDHGSAEKLADDTCNMHNIKMPVNSCVAYVD